MMIFACLVVMGPDYELFCVLKYSNEAICLIAKACLELTPTTGQWAQGQQQTYNSTAEKEKNQGVAMSPDLNLTEILW